MGIGNTKLRTDSLRTTSKKWASEGNNSNAQEEPMGKGDDIQLRLTNLGVCMLRLCDNLPQSGSGRHIADQLRRCGTSPAANYAEARAGESRRDFVHKLGIVYKELKETHVWLTMLAKQYPNLGETIIPMLDEATQLCKIIAVSLRTVRFNNMRS
jgi:four helix bundle protein